MTCYLFDSQGVRKLLTFEAQPVCSVDYCDVCGDCLICYGVDDCYYGGSHLWVLHAGGFDVEGFIMAHAIPEEMAEKLLEVLTQCQG
ncbi:hypothetical protein LCGC14_1648710 [marine sediment metagenome]|uniref:Uncharacterized protein n=1 Tax=marine sediment metagenome TaxID=412755 RepID=A0A0F9KXL0_9ZZZZ